MKKILIKQINGTLSVPGDKSISYRAILLAALSKRKIIIDGLFNSDDVIKTIDILGKCGIKIFRSGKKYIVEGKGLFGLNEPKEILHAGNSGTTLRIVSGLLGAQNFYSILSCDESMLLKPMDRVFFPLTKM